METGIQIASAAVLTSFLVSFAKLAKPNMESWMLAAIALISGVVSAGLIHLQQHGAVMDWQAFAGVIIQGITTAAAAAGITRTDNAGESRRRAALKQPADS